MKLNITTMNRNFIKAISFVSLFAIFACSEDAIVEHTLDNGVINKVSITGADFKNEDGTRSSVSIGESGATFTWSENDTVGIFPNKGSQAEFAMSEGVGTQIATFSGGGWALKSSATYSAYYPYNFYNRDMTKIPVSYVGQTQKGNNNTDHIGAYDFMAASVATPSNGAVAFGMQHLGALLRIQFVLPDNMLIKKTQLVTFDEDFTTDGYVDLCQQSPSIVATKMSNAVSIESTIFVERNDLVTIYMMIAPTNLSGKKLDIVVESNDGFIYRTPVECNTQIFEAGKIYALTGTIVQERTSQLVDGPTFKSTIQSLCSNGSVKGVEFKYSTNTIPSSYKIVSVAGSDYPIYASAEYGYVTISTEADKIYLNENSYMMFNEFDIKSIDVSNLVTDNVTNMQGMFAGCDKLTSLDLSTFNTRKVTNMSLMFNSCNSLKTINLDGWVTDRVTDMKGMFNMCEALESIDLSDFKTSNVTDMYCMFYGCGSLVELKLETFDTRNVTTMKLMFADCKGLTSLDLSNFNTQRVTTMYYMFGGCSSMQTLNLSGFDTKNVTDMSSMFYGAFNNSNSNYQELNLGEYFEISSNTSTDNISNFGNITIKCLPTVKPYLRTLGNITWIDARTGEEMN